MQISGKITQLLPLQTGTGKNGEWAKREFILKPFVEKCKEIAVIVWGENCHHQDLIEGRDINIKCYISSVECKTRDQQMQIPKSIECYPSNAEDKVRWNTQIIGTRFLKLENANKSSCEYEIQLIIERIILPDQKHVKMFESISRMVNYYSILGKSLDKNSNLIFIGLKRTVDISNLKIGAIITVPVKIESSLNYGWKTKLYADRFEIVKT